MPFRTTPMGMDALTARMGTESANLLGYALNQERINTEKMQAAWQALVKAQRTDRDIRHAMSGAKSRGAAQGAIGGAQAGMSLGGWGAMAGAMIGGVKGRGDAAQQVASMRADARAGRPFSMSGGGGQGAFGFEGLGDVMGGIGGGIQGSRDGGGFGGFMQGFGQGGADEAYPVYPGTAQGDSYAGAASASMARGNTGAGSTGWHPPKTTTLPSGMTY